MRKLALMLTLAMAFGLATVAGATAYQPYDLDMAPVVDVMDEGMQARAGVNVPKDVIDLSTEAKMTLGENKGNNMISVMQNAFGIDLTEYQFVSFGDLWDNAAETTYPALRAIAIDRYVEVEQGQRLPLGFLYQGTTAYTVVEQPNGSLEMIKYELLGTDQVQGGEDRVAEQDDMQYKVLETENKMAPQSVVETLYF